MTEYELLLPVCKRGDDLADKIDMQPTLQDAFVSQAESYEEAARMCRRMASVAVEHPLKVYADTLMISVSGPLAVLEALASDGVLDAIEYGDDDGDCDGCPACCTEFSVETGAEPEEGEEVDLIVF